MKIAKLTREPEIHGDTGVFYTMEAIDGILGEIQMSEIGNKLFIEIVDMNQDALDELPEFGGW